VLGAAVILVGIIFHASGG